MATESRQRKCSKCSRELVNENGVHMGIPFGIWQYSSDGGRTSPHHRSILCAKCYDEVTVDLDTKIQRTGEELV